MSIKLDMSKVYNRVEWKFISIVMNVLGFQQSFIDLILFCVKLVSYSVLINEEPKGSIYPTRGLGQKDPLSPYLFLLCTERLTAFLQKAGAKREISGIKICRGT